MWQSMWLAKCELVYQREGCDILNKVHKQVNPSNKHWDRSSFVVNREPRRIWLIAWNTNRFVGMPNSCIKITGICIHTGTERHSSTVLFSATTISIRVRMAWASVNQSPGKYIDGFDVWIDKHAIKRSLGNLVKSTNQANVETQLCDWLIILINRKLFSFCKFLLVVATFYRESHARILWNLFWWNLLCNNFYDYVFGFFTYC